MATREDLINGLNQPQLGGVGAIPPLPGSSSATGSPSAGATSASIPAAAVAPAQPSISERMGELLDKDSSWMRRARTQGLQSANRRGLANSSMGIGAAENAAISAAAPIASQESSQDNAVGINTANLAAAERERQAALYAQLQGNYSAALTNTLNNHEIPAAARSAVQASLRDQWTGGLQFMQNLYGVNYTPQPAGYSPAAPPNYSGIGGGYPSYSMPNIV